MRQPINLPMGMMTNQPHQGTLKARLWPRAKPLLMASLAGLVASLALPPHGVDIAIFALLVPAMQLLRAERGIEAFRLGWMTGFGWFVYSLFWISNALVVSGGGDVLLIPFSAIGLPLFLGLFWGLGFAIAFWAGRNPPSRLVMLAVSLAVMEYTRGFIFTGFPWNAPGMILANHDITLAIAASIGLWGGTLAVLLIAFWPGLVILRAKGLAFVVAIGLLGLWGAGLWQGQAQMTDHPGSGMTVRVIQPNIPQDQKWNRQDRPDHLRALVRASRQETNRDLDLILWPETAFAGFYEHERSVIQAMAQAASSGKTPVLTGTLRVQSPDQFFNSAMMFNPEGIMTQFYDKRHLVPFGEYAPLREFIPFVDVIAGPNDFAQGDTAGPMVITRRDGSAVRLLPLICYEVIFPAAVRRDLAETEADVMVNLTNDAWFGDTIGPRQHLAMAQMRAAETGRPLVRVANTGISAIIDSRGRITHRIDYGTEGVRDAVLSGRLDTLYTRFGDWGFAVMIIMVIVMAFASQFLTPYRRRM